MCPSDRPPELTEPASRAVQIAASDLRGDAPVVELRALFGGLLYGSTQVGGAFNDLLGTVGLTGVVQRYREYLAGKSPGSYAAFLAEFHPFHPNPSRFPSTRQTESPLATTWSIFAPRSMLSPICSPPEASSHHWP